MENNYKGVPYEYHSNYHNKELNWHEHFVLDEEQTEKLIQLCREQLLPRRTANTRVSSYSLKHKAEKTLGFYVANCDMKRAMVYAGFEPTIKDPAYWYFNISQRSPLLKVQSE